MHQYFLQRLLLNVLVIWIVMTFVFVVVRILPGDYAASLVAQRYFGAGAAAGESSEVALYQARERLGLNDSIPVQYGKYLRNLATGNFGRSFATGRPVFAEVRHALPYSIQLGLMTFLVAVLISVPIGMYSAIRQDTPIDGMLRIIAITGLAAPSFWTATIGTLIVLRFHLFTLDIVQSPGIWDDPLTSLQLFIIPALAGGLATGAIIMRFLRSQILDVIRQDYVRTARAKGLSERAVIVRHVVRNALIPVVTVVGFSFISMVSGAIILESMFNIPGMGRAIYTSLSTRDVPLVQAMAFVIALGVVSINLGIDMIYFKLDPRLSAELTV
jgi:peptide/nickel transport system permease protein